MPTDNSSNRFPTLKTSTSEDASPGFDNHQSGEAFDSTTSSSNSNSRISTPIAPAVMTAATTTKLQAKNGACVDEADPFFTLKRAAMMTSAQRQRNSSTSITNNTKKEDSIASRIRANRASASRGRKSIVPAAAAAAAATATLHTAALDIDIEDEGENKVEADDMGDSSSIHCGEGEFEACDDYEEQLICAALLEQTQSNKNSKAEDCCESLSATADTASLSSRESSSSKNNHHNSSNNNHNNSKSLLSSLDSIIGNTGDTMRMPVKATTSISSASTERRRTLAAATALAKGSVRSERTSTSVGSSTTNRGSRRVDRAERTSKRVVRSYTDGCMDSSGRSGSRRSIGNDAMDSSSSAAANSRSKGNLSGRSGRRSTGDGNGSNGEATTINHATSPTNPSRRSRMRDRPRSNSKASVCSASGAGDAETGGLEEGNVTPPPSHQKGGLSKRFADRPNSMELRRVTRDPNRRGRRTTIGHDILMRNLQILDDQGNELAGTGADDEDEDIDDDDCAFDADFGDDASDLFFGGSNSNISAAGAMGGSERNHSTTAKTEVWKQRRLGKSGGSAAVPLPTLRSSRRGSIHEVTAALLAPKHSDDGSIVDASAEAAPATSTSTTSDQGAMPGLRRAHTTTAIAQRRRRRGTVAS